MVLPHLVKEPMKSFEESGAQGIKRGNQEVGDKDNIINIIL